MSPMCEAGNPAFLVAGEPSEKELPGLDVFHLDKDLKAFGLEDSISKSRRKSFEVSTIVIALKLIEAVYLRRDVVSR